MKQSYKIKVFGKVQGVFFRASTKQEAEALGLSGFVRNEADGSVYIEVEGPDDQLDVFLKWCKNGSTFSRVDRIEIHEIPEQGFQEFTIQR